MQQNTMITQWLEFIQQNTILLNELVGKIM